MTVRLHILCLHDVAEHPASPWALTPAEIGRIVDDYRGHGYAIVTLDELPSIPDRALALTVDDARSGALAWLRAAPADVRATVFVVPGWIDEPGRIPPGERYSEFGTWNDLAALRDAGHVIGSHTMTHRALPSLAPEEARRELQESRQRILEVTGTSPRHLAPPFGSVNAALVALAKEEGYVTVSSAAGGVNGPREGQSGLLRRVPLRRDRPRLGRGWTRP